MKTRPLVRLFSRRQFLSVLLVGIMLPGAISLRAESTQYLPPGRPDGLALLAPPPVAGTEEAAEDLATVQKVFHAQPPETKENAKMEEELSLNLFTPAIGSFFAAGKFPKLEALLKEVTLETSKVVKVPKDFYKRPRPHELDPTLPVESNYSYPSSHSTRGTVYALILAEIFPDKKEAILAEGREIGWNRVREARHFPSDVQAGRVLGKAVFLELMESATFKTAFAEAKNEVLTATH